MSQSWKSVLDIGLIILPVIVFAIVLCIVLFYFKKYKHKKFIKKVLKLKVGMPYEQVRKMMGDGTFMQMKENEKICIWELSQQKSATKTVDRMVKVLFKDDKVLSIYHKNIDKKA